MKQSYHSYKRRVRLIRKASWFTLLNTIRFYGGLTFAEIDVLETIYDKRAARLEKQARRNFEARRRGV